MSHTTRAFSKATFPVVVPAAYLYYFTTKEFVEKKEEQTWMVWHHACKLLLKHTIITLILLFYPLFGKDNLFCIIP